VPDDDVPRRPALRTTPPDEVADTGATPAGGADGTDDTGTSADDMGAAGAADPDDTATPGRRRTPLWLETGILLVVALGMALIIKTFLVQAFYIPSASMEPGLVENDRILVQKVSYWFGGSPKRGDVIVFEDPGDATPEGGDDWLKGPEAGPTTILAKGLAKVGLYPTGGHLVKRIIGLPGDIIVCCDEQGRLSINGVAIDEDDFIRPQPDCDGPMVNQCQTDWTVTVPDDRLFVMGDNRAESADSSDRLCGPKAARCDPDRAFVPLDNVVGKVFSLVWPLSHAELIGRPDVFENVSDTD
jgi:signal peptidase I